METPARSYATAILPGEMSALVHMVDTPELFGGELRILAAVKAIWGRRVTTVFPRQGHYANVPKALVGYPPADIQVERIGELVAFDRAAFVPNKDPGVRT